MHMTEAEYQQLKEQIDADAKARIKAETDRVEQERAKDHQALDRIWAVICRQAQAPLETQTPAAACASPAAVNGNGNGAGQRQPLPMTETVRQIVRQLPTKRVTQPMVYKRLLESYRAYIEHRDQQYVRAQVAQILRKFSEGEDAELKLVDKGSGTSPKVYERS